MKIVMTVSMLSRRTGQGVTFVHLGVTSQAMRLETVPSASQVDMVKALAAQSAKVAPEGGILMRLS